MLTPLMVEHAGEMATVLGDPDLHEFIGDRPLSSAALRSRYERLVAGSPDDSVVWLNWVISVRDTGSLVGTVQATVDLLGPTGPVAEVAWVVGTPWQGQGIAGEAATGLVGWLAQQGVARVVAHVHPDHAASAAVARRAGLTVTDLLQDGELRWVRELWAGSG